MAAYLFGMTLIFVFLYIALVQPILPNSHLRKQNQADRGMTKITVTPTQVCDHQSHSVAKAEIQVALAELQLTSLSLSLS